VNEIDRKKDKNNDEASYLSIIPKLSPSKSVIRRNTLKRKATI